MNDVAAMVVDRCETDAPGILVFGLVLIASELAAVLILLAPSV